MNTPRILTRGLGAGKLSGKDKVLFFSNLSTMIGSGLSITEALEIISRQGNKKLSRIAKDIAGYINSGKTLSDAIKKQNKAFSAFHANVISAGENSGRLEESLDNLSQGLEKEEDIREKIKAAMLYPLIIVFLSLALISIMIFFVLPNLTKVFTGLGIELPLSTRIMVFFIEFADANSGRIALSVLFLFIFLSWLFKKEFVKPFLHDIFLRAPIVKNISKGRNISDFCRAMGLLLRSGLSFSESLGIVEGTVKNYCYKKLIRQAKKDVSEGQKLSESLSNTKKKFPEMAISIIKVGERSGRLEEEFMRLADKYEKESSRRIEKLSVIIEPALLILIGLLVAFLALAVITPIYQVTGNMNY